jgi:predicted metalloprotease
MWEGDIFDRPSARIGDFAAAVVVAHEFGHHVVDEISQGVRVPPPQGKDSELIADCFAGAWAASVYHQGLLEEGDVEEAVAALEVIGDVGVSEYPHGTGPERVDAFVAGYAGIEGQTGPGDPVSCFRLYWTA